MKVVSLQDISCYGQCSLTVALPILSHFGIETAILPSGVLSTHTSGFKNYTFLDLTDELAKIIKHWQDENIKFDAIYTGYIGCAKQFDYVLDLKEHNLNSKGLLLVDPAMADNGHLYPGLDNTIVEGMKLISSKADYIFPNITEACLLTGSEYKETYDSTYIDMLGDKLLELGAKKVIITGVSYEPGKIGAVMYESNNSVEFFGDLQPQSYHGTGDIFTSIMVANIVNGKTDIIAMERAVNFVIDCIKNTINDQTHNYGVKFEEILKNY